MVQLNTPAVGSTTAQRISIRTILNARDSAESVESEADRWWDDFPTMPLREEAYPHRPKVGQPRLFNAMVARPVNKAERARVPEAQAAIAREATEKKEAAKAAKEAKKQAAIEAAARDESEPRPDPDWIPGDD